LATIWKYSVLRYAFFFIPHSICGEATPQFFTIHFSSFIIFPAHCPGRAASPKGGSVWFGGGMVADRNRRLNGGGRPA